MGGPLYATDVTSQCHTRRQRENGEFVPCEAVTMIDPPLGMCGTAYFVMKLCTVQLFLSILLGENSQGAIEVSLDCPVKLLGRDVRDVWDGVLHILSTLTRMCRTTWNSP